MRINVSNHQKKKKKKVSKLIKYLYLIKIKNVANYFKQHPKSKNIKTLQTKNNSEIFY